jgi:hypothetical protein
MKKFTILLALLSLPAMAQTKLISHKSHSGSTATFTTAFNNNLFDMGESDFGAAPYRQVKTAQLDSVIYISPDKAIMVTSEFCIVQDRRKQEEIEKTLWKAGRDTVYNHVLFSRNHSLDSIKQVLKNQYHFKNDTDKTVFIGYDNKTRKYKREKRNSLPVLPDTGFPDTPVLVFALTLLSVLTTFISYYFYKTRHNITT